MNVLLALSDPALRAVWDEVLADHGHPGTVTTPDLDGWLKFEEIGFDLVVLEFVRGTEGTLELCRRIGATGRMPRPSILVMAHSDQASESAAALKAGADDVLVGPPDRRAAIAHLTALERRSQSTPATSPTVHDLAAGYQLAELTAWQPSGGSQPSISRALARLETELRDLVNDLQATARRGDAQVAGLQSDLAAALGQARELSYTLGRIRRVAVEGSQGITVLLIDDEATIRQPLRRSLEHCGYRVLEAADGPQGLEIYNRERERIAVVVVDQRMPRMSGDQVVEELKRRDSSLPVILISGHALGDAVGTPGGARPDAFLRKPFELVDLARTLRRFVAPAKAS